MFLSINIVSQVEKDPTVRPTLNTNRPLIGSNNPPIILSSLSVAVDSYTSYGEYVLASKHIMMALGATTHVRSPTYHWDHQYKNHTNWFLVTNALKCKYNYDKAFYYKYNARYLVIGYNDMAIGGRIWNNKPAPVYLYNKSPNFLLIYMDGYKERIYLWIQ